MSTGQVTDSIILDQWNRNPRPQLEPQITSFVKCNMNQLSLDTPVYTISGVWVGGSYSLGESCRSRMRLRRRGRRARPTYPAPRRGRYTVNTYSLLICNVCVLYIYIYIYIYIYLSCATAWTEVKALTRIRPATFGRGQKWGRHSWGHCKSTRKRCALALLGRQQ